MARERRSQVMASGRTGQLMAGGVRWYRDRVNIDLAEARGLVAGADLVVRVRGGRARPVADADRGRTWAEMRDRFDGPGGVIVGPDWPDEPVFTADRYTDHRGHTLLYVEVHC